MYFIIISVLFLTAAYGAPQDYQQTQDNYPTKDEYQPPLPTKDVYEPQVQEPQEPYPQVQEPQEPYHQEHEPQEPYPQEHEPQEPYHENKTQYNLPEKTPYAVEQKPEDIEIENKVTAHITAEVVSGEEIAKEIFAPILIFNDKVAKTAAALPPLFATKGAIIGTAIATPIEIGAVATSHVVNGVAGKFVAVPITLAVDAVSKLNEHAVRGEEIVNFNLEHGGEILKNGLIKVGHIILKPIAIVVGAQTALTGAGLGIVGTGIKGVGVGMKTVGAKLLATGLVTKGLGHRLIAAQFPPYLK